MKMRHLVSRYGPSLAARCRRPPFPGEIGHDQDRRFLPMTGGVAAYGQGSWQGAPFARDMKPTILGKKVELVLVDDKSDKIEDRQRVTRLVEGAVVAIIILHQRQHPGRRPIRKSRRAHRLPTATNPLVTQGKKYLPRLLIDPFRARWPPKYAYETLKKRRRPLIDKAGTMRGRAISRKNHQTGGQIVAKTYCRTGDRTSRPRCRPLAKNPDVLYMPNYYTGGPRHEAAKGPA